MTTEKLTAHQVSQRERQASEYVKSQFERIQNSLLDLSLSDDYNWIKWYLTTETGGCDLETLLNIVGTIQRGLDRVEQDTQQRDADWAYWAKREQESKNDNDRKDRSARAKFAPGAIVYIDPMQEGEGSR
jgi:hypothetical protein